MSNENLRDTIAPKSDQLNADDLLVWPITVQITGVTRGNSEQPISVHITGGYQPYKPCKSMRRVMISVWGDNGADWVGKAMTLYCDKSVKFGGVMVGGIRISHMSGIENNVSLMLTTTRSKRSEYVVKPIPVPSESDMLNSLKYAAAKGSDELMRFFSELPKTREKKETWEAHGEALKKTAAEADAANGEPNAP